MTMLKGKSGIVTGAAQGFGQATAERQCFDGAQVALVDIIVGAMRMAADHMPRRGKALI